MTYVQDGEILIIAYIIYLYGQSLGSCTNRIQVQAQLAKEVDLLLKKMPYTVEWYMHKQKYVSENEMHKIFRDFEIKNVSLNPGKKTLPSFGKKKNSSSSKFCRSNKP